MTLLRAYEEVALLRETPQAQPGAVSPEDWTVLVLDAENKEGTMTDSHRNKYLRIALLLVGLIFIFGIYPLTVIWPSGWSWNPGQSEYLEMILGIYATLGVFLVIASRNPAAHRSLIWFTV